MKHLLYFDTEEDFNTEVAKGFASPNVCYVEGVGVLYNPNKDQDLQSTTYALGKVSSIADVEASDTSATVNYTVIPTYHYKYNDEVGDAISCSKEVTFDANTTYSKVTRSGSFTDDYGVTVNWSLTQKFVAPDGYIDLNLPSGTLWATCNIGASSQAEYGKYFQWGDTVGYTDTSHSTEDTTPYWNNSEYSKYNSTDGLTTLEDSDDAAFVATNGIAHIPTIKQLQELIANTTSKWASMEYEKDLGGIIMTDSVNGIKFTSKADSSKSIFFPAAGFVGNGSLYGKGERVELWSSSLYVSYISSAYQIIATNSGVNNEGVTNRFVGMSVRGVIG